MKSALRKCLPAQHRHSERQRRISVYCTFRTVLINTSRREGMVKLNPRAQESSEGRVLGPSGRRLWPTKGETTHYILCVASLLHPLLSLTHWIFGALSLPYKSSSHSAKCVRCAPPAAAGCVEGGDGPVGPRVLRVLRFDSHFVAEGCGIALMGDEYICRHRRQARCARPPLVAGATTFATV